ncbi:aminoglycoside phosphotransferase [Streptomyces albidoflavus]|uniref:aminoglycoside phosphotransferase n=1 Tax=Streptomyces albidoflavus TaxID=1886 RepID=UPI00188CBD15|nr:aminoglycoside phosphotransferase [Streptomyces albidoflavus]MBF4135453.1 aminoglycoside phosphotransferase [Streptomyces albidoflavus]
MPTARFSVDQLPSAVRAAVEEHTGPLLHADEVGEGFNSEIAVRLTSASGTWHVKGLRTGHPRVWTQDREAAVAPFLTGLAPALHWHVVSHGWDLLGFEALTGHHHADYAPGSPDLPEVVALLNRLGGTPRPGIPLRHAEQRLKEYVGDPAGLDFFSGGHLLHTDLNNTNVLVAEEARPVDWAWATRGAAWLDAACWVIWLITSGHSPASAESRAARTLAWAAAPAPGITAFAATSHRLWTGISTSDPDPWTTRLEAAARGWDEYRAGA